MFDAVDTAFSLDRVLISSGIFQGKRKHEIWNV